MIVMLQRQPLAAPTDNHDNIYQLFTTRQNDKDVSVDQDTNDIQVCSEQTNKQTNQSINKSITYLCN